MLNRVPFGSAGRIVTHGNRQAKNIGHLVLQVSFPDPGTIAVAAPTISFNQQVGGTGEAFRQVGTTPGSDIIDGKGRRIG